MSSTNGYVLGIDLGVNSVGAALLDPSNKKVVWTGVRIFSPGFEGDYESGKEESRARQRRLARQQRRQTDRRRRRMINVFRVLQQYGLLPCGDRQSVLPALDARLRSKYPDSETLPYLLRAKALDQPLELHELGRALYHLAQRRGFRGRTAMEADDDEGGKLKEKIEGLWHEIHQSGSRTLGEYFSRLNPHEVRIRGHRTHRRMYEEEFAAIWDAQRPHCGEILSDDRQQVLHRALFHQRPLKPSAHLVGHCDLEPTERRAPLWALQAQRFRVLCAVNNLTVIERSGTIRRLMDAERQTLVTEALTKSRIPFTHVRKLLGLPSNTRFGIEEGGEKNLPGNATSSRIFEVLGTTWLDLSAERQCELVSDLADTTKHETDEDLYNCMTGKWGLDSETAQQLCSVPLPSGYASLSLRALEKVIPAMEDGTTFAHAKRSLWPEQFTEKEPLDSLPPVRDALPEVRNPGVVRALTELRKVVNAIIGRYGRPASIHIELARDMKRTRDERQKESRRHRDREKLRDQARKELKPFLGTDIPGRQIEKYLLWLECGKQCPYTGKAISLEALFGSNPRFDVEHIIPFERSLDDSFQNKTLCDSEFNKLKGKRTPWEASGHSEEWPFMVERVRAFRNAAKLRRFTMTETDTDKLIEDFTTRQLNDTKYASRLAATYLGLLFGIERADNRRIITCAGGVTAFLRRKWDLNRILNARPEKSRDDHRHHAVDAIAVAMASPRQVKLLADAASRALAEGHRRFGSLADPWPEFRDQCREKVLGIVVSHRPKRRLKGALHQETHYSAPEQRNGKTVVRYRVPVTSLTASDFPDEEGKNAPPKTGEERTTGIVDERISEIVKTAWESAGKDAKKLQDNWPVIVAKGRRIPIRRVRCFKVMDSVQPIAASNRSRTRYVIPDGNHHMEIWAELDQRTGSIRRWGHRTVSRLEATDRYRRGERIVQRVQSDGRKFCFSLSEGDMIAAPRVAGGEEAVWCVRTVRARGSFELQRASDARLKKESEIWDVVLNTLMKLGARKVSVTPLGEVVEAHD